MASFHYRDQNALLKFFVFQTFFSPGNKETFIVEICLRIEATQGSLAFIVNGTIMHIPYY